MKHLFTLLALVSLISCVGNQHEEISYKRYSTNYGTYWVEVPTEFSLNKTINDFLYFVGDDNHTIVTIDHLKTNQDLMEYAESRNSKSKKDNFTYTIKEQTDSSLFFKVTRGLANPWSASTLYMMKHNGNDTYVIYLTSDRGGMERNIEIIKHIYSSMDFPEKYLNLSATLPDSCEMETYSNDYFSISYPKGWLVAEKPDEMSDVYIGSEEQMLGFTVLHFDTDFSLNEVIEENNAGMKSAGGTIASNERIKLCGVNGNKAIYKNFGGMDVTQVSYTIIKNNTLYNINFGNSPKAVEDNKAIIDKIANSIKIK